MPEKRLKPRNKLKKRTRRTRESSVDRQNYDDEYRYDRRDYHDDSRHHPEPPYRRVKSSSKPTIAGILLLIAGILGIIFAGFAGFIGVLMGDMESFIKLTGSDDNTEISGEVIYESGIPVEDVNISILGTTIFTNTDENGKFSLENVPVGKQRIKVEKENYNTIIYKTFIFPTGEEWWAGLESDEENRDNYYEFVLEPGDRELEKGSYPPFEVLSSVAYVCAIVFAITSVFAIIGGYFALKRSNFSMAIIGAILGIFSLGFVIGSIFAIIAIVLLFLSKDEFTHYQRPKEPEDDQYKPYY
jgi:hypothetical protein